MTRPRLRPTGPASDAARRPRAAVGRRRGGRLHAVVARRLRARARRPSVSCSVAHAAVPSMTRSSTRCSSSSVGRRLVHDARPRAITSTRSARPSTSGISLETTTTATPRSARRADRARRSRCGADVDAAGRLVEQQHPAAAQQPAGQHDLLLVAAGQRAHRRGRRPAGRTSRRSVCSRAAAPLGAARRGSRPRANRPQAGQRDVAVDRLVEQQRPGSCAPPAPARPRPAPPRATDAAAQRACRRRATVPAVARRAP